MHQLSMHEFIDQRHAFDQVVAASPHVDRFCSSSPWLIAAKQAFFPESTPLILRGQHGWVPLMHQQGPNGLTLLPLEAVWGMACPLVGPDPEQLLWELENYLAASALPWDALYLCGLDPLGPTLSMAKRRFGKRHRLGLGGVTRRRQASLEGGFEGFMARRSANFRAGLRRAIRRAELSGISYEDHAPIGADQLAPLMDRVMTVEEASWKGREELGIDGGSMRSFYEHMTAMLADTGALRLSFVRREDRDIAYVFGGVLGSDYRGLQISFEDEGANLSPGNLAQAHMIDILSREGVRLYDLGMSMPYKRRWAELERNSVMLAALR